MKKIITLVIVVLGSSLAAGIYGFMHDMITYRISPEYYIHYKFIEFGLIETYDQKVNNPQLLAGVAGFMATWWIGFIMGLMIGGIVFKFSNATTRQVVIISLINSVVIFLITGTCGAMGWLWGNYITNGSTETFYIHGIFLDQEKTRNLTIVSFIHSFGYMGGVVGFVVAVLRTFKLKND